MCREHNLLYNADNCKFHKFWVTSSHAVIYLLLLLVLAFGVIYEGKPLKNTLILLPFLFIVFSICQWLWAWMLPLSFEISEKSLIMKGAYRTKRVWKLSSIKKVIVSKNNPGCSLHQSINFVYINGNISNYSSLLNSLKKITLTNKGKIE